MRVFFAYSNDDEDEILYKELLGHMKMSLIKKVLAFTDKDIAFKSNINVNNYKELAQNNDIVIALLSADFFSDPQCIGLLKESNIQNKKILPLLGRECLYEEVEELKPYLTNVIPSGNSIKSAFGNTTDTDEVFAEVVDKINEFLFGKIQVKLHSGLPFLYVAILSFVIGIGSSIYAYTTTNDPILMSLTMGLFMTICIVSLSRYFVLTPNIKKII
ncbi:MAG: hypothetical protein IPJ13_01435 [Saprospiraceae bacterium]|nr:hypothetical protein [Saprospiraceae bacterium]